MMYSSKIYKSGSSVNAEGVVLKQFYSPEAIKELLKLENIRKQNIEKKKTKRDVSAHLLKIEKEAYEKGFKAGERAGLEIADEKANVIINRIEAIYEEITGFKERYFSDNKDELLSLVISAAEKVVHDELKINKDVVLKVLESAIESMTSSEKVEIRMNPEDLEYHREKNTDFLIYLEKARGFSIVEDR